MALIFTDTEDVIWEGAGGVVWEPSEEEILAQAQGSYGRIIIQEEDVSYKTDPSPAGAEKIKFVSESLRLSRELVTSATITGTRNPAQPVAGNTDVAGDIVTELQAYSDVLVRACLGKATSSGGGPYTHTIIIDNSGVNAAPVPSYMIEKGFMDFTTPEYLKYNGCKMNSMGLSVSPEGFQELTTSWIGASETRSTTSFQATPTTDLTHTPFSGFQASILEGSPTPSAISSVLTANFTVENNLDGSVYVIGGSGERAALPEGIVKVSGTISTLFENVTLYLTAIGQANEAESGLQIKFTKTAGSSGAAGQEYCEFYMPELWFAPNAPIVEGPTGVKIDLPFEAYYGNSTQSTSMQVIFKNPQNRGWAD